MQRRIHSMIGYTIRATDGDLGKVHEFYLDDSTWTIRYLVAETGSWLNERKVLISLVALGKPDWESRTFSVNLSCDQVRNSPDIDTERPVSRQHEIDLHAYYLWPEYWGGGYAGTLGISSYPLYEIPSPDQQPQSDRKDDPHLRSTRQLTGYQIHATDGEIGHVQDFVVNDEGWAIQYLVVDTGTWLPGRKVLIAPKWIKSVKWGEASVHLDRSREEVKNSPEFDV